MDTRFKPLCSIWTLALLLVLANPSRAGKLGPAQKEELNCYVLASLTSSTDKTRALGVGNFCTPKDRRPIRVTGPMKLGFGADVQDIAPGFMPPAGPDYAVMPGDKFFWAWPVTNPGTTPINSELLSHFRQNTRVISVHYVKGDMPTDQLPWSQVLDAKDAGVHWTVQADNAEILLQILQAPPGNGYIVLYLQQRY